MHLVKEIDTMKFDRKIDDIRFVKFSDQPLKIIEFNNYCHDNDEGTVIQRIIDAQKLQKE